MRLILAQAPHGVGWVKGRPPCQKLAYFLLLFEWKLAKTLGAY